MDWTKKLDPLLRPYLETQIKETLRYKEAIKTAKNPREAQLWCGIARLSQHNHLLNNRIKTMEKLLIKLLEKKDYKNGKDKEFEELIKTIKRF